jgi:predicted ester cyclase
MDVRCQDLVPRLQGTVEDVIADGDRVAARMTWHGTHRGDFSGLGPTEERVSFSAFHLVWCVFPGSAPSNGGERLTCWGRCSN